MQEVNTFEKIPQLARTLAELSAAFREARNRLYEALARFEKALDSINVPINVEDVEPFYRRETEGTVEQYYLAFKDGLVYVTEYDDNEFCCKLSFKQLSLDQVLALLESGRLIEFLQLAAERLATLPPSMSKAAETIEKILQAIRLAEGQ